MVGSANVEVAAILTSALLQYRALTRRGELHSRNVAESVNRAADVEVGAWANATPWVGKTKICLTLRQFPGAYSKVGIFRVTPLPSFLSVAGGPLKARLVSVQHTSSSFE